MEPENIGELSPELSKKIFDIIEKRLYEESVSKNAVLHHLKQLKAQMGKLKKSYTGFGVVQGAVMDCMEMIDKKIQKIKTQ